MIMSVKQYFENDLVRMEIRNGILFQYYKAGINFNLDVSKRIVKSRVDFLKGRNYPVVIVDEGIVSMDRASRTFFASDEGLKGVSKAAFVETSVFSHMLIRFFFLRMQKALIASCAFTNTREAINWLKRDKSQVIIN